MADGTKVPDFDDAFWHDGKTTRRRFVGWGGGILGATMLVPAPWRAAFGAEKS